MSFTDLIRVYGVGRGYESQFQSSYNHQTSPVTLTPHNWTQKYKALILHLQPRTVSSVRQVRIVRLVQFPSTSVRAAFSQVTAAPVQLISTLHILVSKPSIRCLALLLLLLQVLTVGLLLYLEPDLTALCPVLVVGEREAGEGLLV